MPRLNSRSRGFALGATTALMVKGPLLAAALTWTSDAVQSLDRTQGWVAHTQAVITEADGILAALADAETGQRDFMLSNDAKALELYQDSILRVGVSVNALGRLVVAGAAPAVPLERLWQVADERLEDLATRVHAQQEAGGAAFAMADAGRGQRLMREARATIGAFREGEMQRLQHQLQTASHETKKALASFALAGAIALGLLVMGAITYRRRPVPGIDFSQIRLSLAERST